jgi:hypothetical protein
VGDDVPERASEDQYRIIHTLLSFGIGIGAVVFSYCFGLLGFGLGNDAGQRAASLFTNEPLTIAKALLTVILVHLCFEALSDGQALQSQTGSESTDCAECPTRL